MLGDIRIKSIGFENDDVIIWYTLEVGQNSQANCSCLLTYDKYKELGSDDNLINFIKKEIENDDI